MKAMPTPNGIITRLSTAIQVSVAPPAIRRIGVCFWSCTQIKKQAPAISEITKKVVIRRVCGSNPKLNLPFRSVDVMQQVAFIVPMPLR